MDIPPRTREMTLGEITQSPKPEYVPAHARDEYGGGGNFSTTVVYPARTREMKPCLSDFCKTSERHEKTSSPRGTRFSDKKSAGMDSPRRFLSSQAKAREYRTIYIIKQKPAKVKHLWGFSN